MQYEQSGIALECCHAHPYRTDGYTNTIRAMASLRHPGWIDVVPAVHDKEVVERDPNKAPPPTKSTNAPPPPLSSFRPFLEMFPRHP